MEMVRLGLGPPGDPVRYKDIQPFHKECPQEKRCLIIGGLTSQFLYNPGGRESQHACVEKTATLYVYCLIVS